MSWFDSLMRLQVLTTFAVYSSLDSEMTWLHKVKKMFFRISDSVPRPKGLKIINSFRFFFLKVNAKPKPALFYNPVKCIIALGSEICIKPTPFTPQSTTVFANNLGEKKNPLVVNSEGFFHCLSIRENFSGKTLSFIVSLIIYDVWT